MAVLQQDLHDQRMLVLVNRFRAQNGLKPLSLSEELDRAADKHSKRMATGDFFSHRDPITGSNMASRARAEGFSGGWLAENIAGGRNSADGTFQQWVNSPGHRANLLNPNFTHMGLGYAYQANDSGSKRLTHYWTQTFGAGDPSPGAYIAQTDTWRASSGIGVGQAASGFGVGQAFGQTHAFI